VEVFFDAVRQLTASGRTVIFITHKLDEVIRYTDCATIMRAGRVVATFPTSASSHERLNELMVGGAEPAREGAAQSGGATVLSISQLGVEDQLREVDLELRAGELVALAGVAGNGQTALAEAITGHVGDYRGSIRIAGREIRSLGARAAYDLGVAYVPESRRDVGLVPGLSVAVNLALRRYDRPPFSTRGWVDDAAVRRHALALIERYGIQPLDPDIPVGRLSGGNQQRVIIAREFSGDPRLIVADNFTRGLDPRSTQQFTHELFAHRDRGAAVLWITGDLTEARLCDRVAVMNRGRIVAVLERAEATRERVGLLMSGDVPESVSS
jgi:general nucleoside transport system ATP-binding protein